ncbi:MAG: hypothetical protein ACE5IW_12805 [bacterium]
MSNCPISLSFSKTHSDKRLEKAYETFGINTINQIISFTLFLLGAKRQDIAQYLEIPMGTFLSFLTRTDRYGLSAFEDRRKSSPFKVVRAEAPLKISLDVTEQNLIIQLNGNNQSIIIPRENQLQCKVILLTFLNNGLLSAKEVSDVLGLSVRHTRELNTKMHEGDVSCLIDKRKGQIHDYRFTPEIKAELIQQVAANAITGKPTSSRVISEQINERCNLTLPDRSIRLHMKKLGLPKISESLPTIVEDLKKTPSNDH